MLLFSQVLYIYFVICITLCNNLLQLSHLQLKYMNTKYKFSKTFWFLCFFDRKGSGYPIIRDSASHAGLVLTVTHIEIDPEKRTDIPTSYAGSILKPHNSCNLIPLMCGTKQVRIWYDRSPYDNYTTLNSICHPKMVWNWSWA